MVEQQFLALDIAAQAAARLGGATEVIHTTGADMCRIVDHDRGVWVGLTVWPPRALCHVGRIPALGGWSHAIGPGMLIPNAANIGDVVAAVRELWRRAGEE